jgi:flagellar hook-basal body complex protein FliE
MNASMLALQARIEADAQALSKPAIRSNVGEISQGESGPQGFAQGFMEIVKRVNEQDRVASEKMAAVDAGQSDDLVGAMLASQQASLSFAMLMQARNKIVGAMEDLIKLQL